MSVDADQPRSIRLLLMTVAVRFDGTDGGVVSAVVPETRTCVPEARQLFVSLISATFFVLSAQANRV